MMKKSKSMIENRKISRNNRNIYETYENELKNKKTNENIRIIINTKKINEKLKNKQKQEQVIRNCIKNMIMYQNNQKV